MKSSAGTDVDGAETPVEESDVDVDGWVHSTGTETVDSERYYLLENRQYVGYDATLAEGPYQFSEAFTRPELGRVLQVPGRHARLARRPGLHRQQRQ